MSHMQADFTDDTRPRRLPPLEPATPRSLNEPITVALAFQEGLNHNVSLPPDEDLNTSVHQGRLPPIIETSRTGLDISQTSRLPDMPLEDISPR